MSLLIEYSDLQAKRLVYWIIAIECLFAVAYILMHILTPEMTWGPFRNLFDLDAEQSLPSWFSVVQLFIVGSLLILATRNNQHTERLSNFALIIAGIVFIGLSADEGAQIHERIDYVFRTFERQWLLVDGKWGAWIAIYGLLGLIAIVLGAKHLFAIWHNFRFVALVGLAGAAIYVIGSVGFEVASFPFRNSEATLMLKLVTVVFEEFFEMLGVSIILYATLILSNRLSTPRGDAAL
jgi:hypothetical protein